MRDSGGVSLWWLSMIGSLMLAGACAKSPVVAKTLPSPVLSREYDVLDPRFIEKRVGDLNADAPGDTKDGEAYRVGPGDSLLVAG